MAPPHTLLGRRPFVLGLASMALPRLGRAQTAAPLSVRIEEPGGGVLRAQDTARLVAAVSDPSVLTATITVHGMSYEVPVRDGRVEQTVVVLPGTNRVGVGVRRGDTVARDSVTFHVDGDPVDLVVLLGWSARGEIIDLWVREPDGETVKWDHRESTPGGRLLDFSSDAIGFGSQAYLRASASAGRYRVKVHYWSDGARRGDRDDSAFEEALERLHAIDARLRATPPPSDAAALSAERAGVTARLDAWGLPSGAQTPLHAEVLLFANTPRERRWRFDLTAQRSGQLQTLGEIEVTSAMLLDARRTLP
ncbi:MAG: hypothetical protein EPO40_03330 [Myxococcaceae bacterium]|nr:MAG: hypothetical protein EPO40_03330 [Myxococcaceae bacterium]